MSDQPKKTAEDFARAYFEAPDDLGLEDPGEFLIDMIRQAMQQAHREGLREGLEDAYVDAADTCHRRYGPGVALTAGTVSRAIRARSAERLGEKPDA